MTKRSAKKKNSSPEGRRGGDAGKRPRRGPGQEQSAQQRLDMTTGETLVATDNPDDAEIFDTGDASDFAAETRKRNAKHRQGNRSR